MVTLKVFDESLVLRDFKNLICSWFLLDLISDQTNNFKKALKEGGYGKKLKNEKHSQTIKTDEF